MEKAKLTILNTKARWFNEGEQSTKYFLNLQKRRSNDKNMKAVFLDDGTLTNERNRVLKETKSFYEQLYKANPNVRFDLKNESDRYLTDEERTQADLPLSLQDITTAVNSNVSWEKSRNRWYSP